MSDAREKRNEHVRLISGHVTGADSGSTVRLVISSDDNRDLKRPKTTSLAGNGSYTISVAC